MPCEPCLRGADGIMVSNHGARQLDRAPAPIDALPAIRAAVGDRAQITLDGGVRRGADVVTALCLGADAVFIGRPALYGAVVGGSAGVRKVLDILAAELQIDSWANGLSSHGRSWPALHREAGPRRLGGCAGRQGERNSPTPFVRSHPKGSQQQTNRTCLGSYWYGRYTKRVAAQPLI